MTFFFFLNCHLFHQSLTSGSLTCEEILDPFEWLLNQSSIKPEVLKSAICQNVSLEHVLLAKFQPLVQKVKSHIYLTWLSFQCILFD